jgi:hypothetical protein
MIHQHIVFLIDAGGNNREIYELGLLYSFKHVSDDGCVTEWFKDFAW